MSRRPVRSSARGSSHRRAPRSATSKMPLYIGLLVIVLSLVFYMATKNNGETPDQDDTTASNKVSDNGGSQGDNSSKSDSDNIFDLGKVESANKQSAQPLRVVGREPKTVKMDNLSEHVGRLYMTDEANAAIQTLNETVQKHLAERWDLPADNRTEFKRLLAICDERKAIPFLRDADFELRKYNTIFEKKDLHQRDKDGNLFKMVFEGFAMKPYAVFVQRHQDGEEETIATDVVDQLTQLKADYISYFSKFMELDLEEKKDSLIKVMVLRTQHDYNVYNRIKAPDRDKTQTVAHYEPGSNMLVVPYKVKAQGKSDTMYDGEPDYYRKLVMFHEGTHQLSHTFAGQKHLSAYGSMWSDEGLAEYFGGYAVDKKGRYTFRSLNMIRCRDATFFGQGTSARRIPLKDVIKWTRSTQKREERKNLPKANYVTGQVYWQGWALVEFLNNHENGRYRAKFQELMRQQFEDGDTGLPVFRKAFPGDSYEKLEKEFHAWLDNLVTAQREKRIYNGKIHSEPRKN